MTNLRLQAYDNIHHVEEDQYFCLLRHENEKGQKRGLLIPRSLKSQPAEIKRQLLNNGAQLSHPESFEADLSKVLGSAMDAPWDIRERCGWHGDAYITEYKTHALGQKTYHPHRVKKLKAKEFSQATYRKLKCSLEEFSAESCFATFAIAAGFAGPVMELLDQRDGAAFYFHGETSSGKTTLLNLARSIRYQEDTMASFDTSARGIEEIAFRNNDATMVLDELGVAADSDKEGLIAKMAYKLVDGHGKRKSSAKAVQGAYPDLRWRTLLLSTGEIDIDQFEQREQRKGQKVRLIQVDIPSKDEGGIFAMERATLPLAQRSRMFQRFQEAASEHDGYAFDRFLHFLVREKTTLSFFARIYASFFLRLSASGNDSFRIRRAKKFALIAAAGELAGMAKLLDWEVGFASRAVLQVYERCDKQRMAAEKPLDATMLSRVLFAKSTAPVLFPRVDKGQSFPSDLPHAMGFIRKEQGEVWIYVDADHIEAALETPNRDSALDALVAAGIAMKPEKRQTPFFQKLVGNYPKSVDRPSFLKVSSDRLAAVAQHHPA